MEINTLVESFLSIGIVGVILSTAIQYIQDKYGAEGTTTKLIAIGGSIVLGTFVYFVSALPIWSTIVGVLAAASTAYAMFFAGKRTNAREDV